MYPSTPINRVDGSVSALVQAIQDAFIAIFAEPFSGTVLKAFAAMISGG